MSKRPPPIATTSCQAEDSTTTFFAHSGNEAGIWQPMVDHLSCVASMARYFAGSVAADEAELAGLLHDLGKYGDRFRLRLRNMDSGHDHWSAGAWVALSAFRSVAAAMAIQGHHIGLQQMDKDSLLRLNPKKLQTAHPLGL